MIRHYIKTSGNLVIVVVVLTIFVVSLDRIKNEYIFILLLN